MAAPSDAVRQGSAAGPRSHLADGRVVVWAAPYSGELVIDAELTDRAPPARLAEEFGTAGFWARWTRAECLAKLAGVPILLWLREHGLDGEPPADVRLETLRATWLDPHLVVSVGMRSGMEEV